MKPRKQKFIGDDDPALRIGRGFTDSTREALTAREVSIRLNLTTRTLGSWRRNGIGPSFYKFGKIVRYPADKLEEFERKMLLRKNSDQQYP